MSLRIHHDRLGATLRYHGLSGLMVLLSTTQGSGLQWKWWIKFPPVKCLTIYVVYTTPPRAVRKRTWQCMVFFPHPKLLLTDGKVPILKMGDVFPVKFSGVYGVEEDTKLKIIRSIDSRTLVRITFQIARVWLFDSMIFDMFSSLL